MVNIFFLNGEDALDRRRFYPLEIKKFPFIPAALELTRTRGDGPHCIKLWVDAQAFLDHRRSQISDVCKNDPSAAEALYELIRMLSSKADPNRKIHKIPFSGGLKKVLDTLAKKNLISPDAYQLEQNSLRKLRYRHHAIVRNYGHGRIVTTQRRHNVRLRVSHP